MKKEDLIERIDKIFLGSGTTVKWLRHNVLEWIYADNRVRFTYERGIWEVTLNQTISNDSKFQKGLKEVFKNETVLINDQLVWVPSKVEDYFSLLTTKNCTSPYEQLVFRLDPIHRVPADYILDIPSIMVQNRTMFMRDVYAQNNYGFIIHENGVTIFEYVTNGFQIGRKQKVVARLETPEALNDFKERVDLVLGKLYNGLSVIHNVLSRGLSKRIRDERVRDEILFMKTVNWAYEEQIEIAIWGEGSESSHSILTISVKEDQTTNQLENQILSAYRSIKQKDRFTKRLRDV